MGNQLLIRDTRTHSKGGLPHLQSPCNLTPDSFLLITFPFILHLTTFQNTMRSHLLRLLFFLGTTGMAFAQTPQLQWSALYGGSGQNSNYDVVHAQQGKVLTCGIYSATMTIGSQTLPNAGAMDGYVTMFSATGQPEWSKRLSGSADDIIRCVHQDAQGDVFLAGQYASPASFDGNSLPYAGETDGFLARLNPDGQIVWIKTSTNTGNMNWNRVATDASGNTIALGQFTDTLILGTNTLISNSFPNLVLAKWNPAGDLLWAKSWGAAGADNGFELCVAPSGHIVVSADYQGPITLGNLSLPWKGLSDALVFQTDPDGNPVWAQSIGGKQTDNGFAVTIAENGDVIAAGCYMDTLKVNNTTLVSKGAWDLFLFRFTSTGEPVWGRSLGGKENDRCNSVGVGPDGRIYMHGWFQDTLVTGPFSLPSMGSFDGFVAQFESDGQPSGAFSYGSSNLDVGAGMDIDSEGNLILAGYFFGSSITFGTQSLVSNTATTHYLFRTGPFISNIRNKQPDHSPILCFQEGDRMNFRSSETGDIEVLDAMGRRVFQSSISAEGVCSVSLPEGIYRYRFATEKKVYSSAFLSP